MFATNFEMKIMLFKTKIRHIDINLVNQAFSFQDLNYRYVININVNMYLCIFINYV